MKGKSGTIAWLRLILLSLLAAPLATAIISASAIAQSITYDHIETIGNVRIDDTSLVRISGLPSSGTVSSGTLNEAYRAISDRALFEEISIIPKGRTLEISVVEFPIINRISIEGNRRIKDKVLTANVQSQPKQVYLPSLAEEDADRIAELYLASGRFASTVTPKIIRRRDNRVDIVFEVIEGRVVEIERISFIGNKAFTDNRLRRVLASKQANILRAFVTSDTYLNERIELDKTLLTDFYVSRGYVDFKILSTNAELAREQDAFSVVFKVQEGELYSVGNITASSTLSGIDVDVFLSEHRLKVGSAYSPYAVEQSVKSMEYLASNMDLDFIRVRPEISIASSQILDVNFNIERGPRIIIERIEIEGNTTTLDRVVRRQFNSAEGDPFEPQNVAAAAERIRALGFFSNVEVDAEFYDENRSVIKVEVDEQPTGALSFGVSYSRISGLGTSITLTERNFLGRGQTLGFTFGRTTGDQEFELFFIEPSLFDRKVSLGFNVGYLSEDKFISLENLRTFNLSTYLGFPAGEFSNIRVGGAFRREDADKYTGPSKILKKEFCTVNSKKNGCKKFSRSQVLADFSYTISTIGSGIYPKRGYGLRLNQEFAFGGGGTVMRSTAKAIAQTTILKDDVTLSATLEGGWVTSTSGSTLLIDRFHTNTSILRGFAPFGIGPRSKIKPSEEALGGNMYAALRLESQFPIGNSEQLGISGAAFIDAGSVWNLDNTAGCKTVDKSNNSQGSEGCNVNKEEVHTVDDSMKLRVTAGVSVLWSTPIGPLRLNFTRPLKHFPGDEPLKFEITLQSQF